MAAALVPELPVDHRANARAMCCADSGMALTSKSKYPTEAHAMP